MDKPRVLIVEDHEETLHLLSRTFERHGCEVVQARTVEEASHLARTGDKLVCDIGLPDGTGWDLMLALKDRGVQGVAVSGHDDPQTRKRSLRAGFIAHLGKPLNMKQLWLSLFASSRNP